MFFPKLGSLKLVRFPQFSLHSQERFRQFEQLLCLFASSQRAPPTPGCCCKETTVNSMDTAPLAVRLFEQTNFMVVDPKFYSLFCGGRSQPYIHSGGRGLHQFDLHQVSTGTSWTNWILCFSTPLPTHCIHRRNFAPF